MLKTLASMILLVLPVAMSAQTVQPPPAVINDLSSRFPGVDVKDWDTTREGGWKAELDVNEVEHEVFYSAKGAWLWSDHDVKRAQVPQAVWDALAASEYADWTVDGKERLQTPVHKELYEIKLEKKKEQDVYLFFLPDGSRTSGPARQ